MGMDSTWGSTHLQRQEIFSTQVKEMFEDQKFARQFVRWINDIPMDSIATTLKISSVGNLTMDQAAESKSLPSRRMDTGQFQFNIDEFPGLKVEFTRTFMEEDFLASQVMAMTPKKMMDAMDAYLETKIFQLHQSQTNNNANSIYGASHRLVASGNGTNEPTNALTVEDFAYAKYALREARAPLTNLIAVVPASTAFQLDLTANITDISYNPRWQGMIETGMLMPTGVQFLRNIYGFDVYVSDFLDATIADEAALTTYDGTAVADTTGYKAALFMSLGQGDAQPFVGAWGRTPRVESWEDTDLETEYHKLTAKFGLGLYRPESLITMLTYDAIA